MANDLEGRADNLGEAVAILSERVTHVEHEQLDKRLGDISYQFDRRLEVLDKHITDRWVLSVSMGLVVLLMTLYRFVHPGPLP